MVYLDGDHTFDGVTKDIKLWLPKVKKRGILAGHDYYSETYTDKRVPHYCDVKEAVRGIFGDAHNVGKCAVWWKVVN